MLEYFGIRIDESASERDGFEEGLPVSLTLWGSGSPFREFLHASDLADAVVMLIEKYDYNDIGEFVNIGSGSDISIRDLACIIKNVVGFNGMVFFDSTRPDGTPKKLLDVTRINNLGWKYATGLDEGLKGLYKWYGEIGQIQPENRMFKKS